MGKKIIAGILVWVILCTTVLVPGSEVQVKAAEDFQATLSEGVLKWEPYSGTRQYQIIIQNEQGESVSSHIANAYSFEDETHTYCSYDVMGKLQEMGEQNEGTYKAYVKALLNGGASFQSNIVEFAYISHEHQWENGFQYDGTAHWHACKSAHCYITMNEQKKGYGKHSFVASIQTKATEKKEGVRKYTCKVCGYSKTEKIPKLTAAQQKVESAPLLTKMEQTVIGVKGNKDPSGSNFSVLQAKAKKIGSNYVTLSWTKVEGATEYIVYGNQCGSKYKYEKIATLANKTSFKVTKLKNGSKLKKGTYYKFLVIAVAKDSEKKEKALATSKTVHFITTGNKKFGDFTKVTVKKKKVSVGVKKSITIKATKVKPKKKKVQEHRKLSYESGNLEIATVNKKGKITGKKKGTCIVYVYAQNGVFAKVTVTVK